MILKQTGCKGGSQGSSKKGLEIINEIRTKNIAVQITFLNVLFSFSYELRDLFSYKNK